MPNEDTQPIEYAEVSGTVTLGQLFDNAQLSDFADQMDMLSDDQAWQVAKMVAEMIRQVEARRQNLSV